MAKRETKQGIRDLGHSAPKRPEMGFMSQFMAAVATVMRIHKNGHFKGGVYRVLLLAVDIETGDRVVVYRNESSGATWMRQER